MRAVGAGDVEDRLGQLRRHDVRVVSVGDGDEHVGVLDAGRAQDILVNAGADDGDASEILWQSAETRPS